MSITHRSKIIWSCEKNVRCPLILVFFYIELLQLYSWPNKTRRDV